MGVSGVVGAKISGLCQVAIRADQSGPHYLGEIGRVGRTGVDWPSLSACIAPRLSSMNNNERPHSSKMKQP